MPDPALPPADASALDIARDYRRHLVLRLYGNAVNRAQQRTPASYVEPSFKGYAPQSGLLWDEVSLDPDGRGVRLRAVASFTRLDTGAAATVRGWYLAVPFADDTVGLLADGAAPQALTLAEDGHSVAVALDLYVRRFAGAPEFDGVQCQGLMSFVSSGSPQMQFKGNDRKLIQGLQKAIDACQARDARWTGRSASSSMASVQIFPAGDADLQAAVSLIESRLEELRLS